MLALFSLLPATIFVTIGYFVLFSSTRASGAVKRMGEALAVWTFVLAGGVVVGSLAAPSMGLDPFRAMAVHMQRMEQAPQQASNQVQKAQ